MVYIWVILKGNSTVYIQVTGQPAHHVFESKWRFFQGCKSARGTALSSKDYFRKTQNGSLLRVNSAHFQQLSPERGRCGSRNEMPFVRIGSDEGMVAALGKRSKILVVKIVYNEDGKGGRGWSVLAWSSAKTMLDPLFWKSLDSSGWAS